MDKVFEEITSVTYLGIDLACATMHLHYPPDTMTHGAAGDRTRVINHSPGTLTATMFPDTEGLVQLAKLQLAGRGHGLVGTLEIAAKNGPYVIEDAVMLEVDERTGRCKFNVSR